MYEHIREILRRIATKDRFDAERIQQEGELINLLVAHPYVLNQVDMYEQSLLIWASACGNISVVQHLISNGVNLNAATHCPGAPDHGKTALHWAYARGYYDVVYQLIEAGANDTGINNRYRITKSRGNQTVTAKIVLVNNHVIHRATKDARFTIVEALISKDAALLEQKNKEGETPLLLAARYAFERGVNYFIAQGADINVATHRPGHQDHEKTALHWVYERGSLKQLKILMERGAVDTRVCGDYVCDNAIKDGRLDVIQLFFEFNPNFWIDNALSIDRWIGLASGHMVWDCFDNKKTWEPGWPDIVEYLALSAASHNIELNHRSQTALAASREGLRRTNQSLSALKFIESGVGLNAPIHNPGQPNHGKTAVEWAYESKRYIEMGFLLDAGANVDYLLGQRLIFLATKCANISTVERLLDEHPRLKSHKQGGFQHTAIDLVLEQGEFVGARFPLILAARKGYTNIVRDLIKKGEDVNAVVNQPECLDTHGKTALHLAYESGQHDIVEILRDAGASNDRYTEQAEIYLTASSLSSFSIFNTEATQEEDSSSPSDFEKKRKHSEIHGL